ncbi:hypothetical protein EJ110_NYTH35801 [Nymphaea thermarum]|nr:hypothetical protein EJ110_NYTH35801 [Nymphaea thermarum]
MKWIQPRTQNENQGHIYQNTSGKGIELRLEASSEKGVHHMGLLPLRKTNPYIEDSTCSHKGLLPLPTKTVEPEILRESNQYRPKSEASEQTEIKSSGHPATDNNGLLPPPSISTSENQPKKGGMDHILLESPSKKAQMELQQWATQEIANESAKLDRARDKGLTLVKQQSRREVVATSNKKNEGSSKTGCKQRSQPLNIQKILDEELLAEMDGILPESEEDNTSIIGDRHGCEMLEIGATGDQRTMTTFTSPQRQLHPKEGCRQHNLQTLGNYIEKLYPERWRAYQFSDSPNYSRELRDPLHSLNQDMQGLSLAPNYREISNFNRLKAFSSLGLSLLLVRPKGTALADLLLTGGGFTLDHFLLLTLEGVERLIPEKGRLKVRDIPRLQRDNLISVQLICAHLNEGEGLRLTGESLPRRAVRSCRPVTTGIRAQISGNLGKRLESRCRSSRRLATIEESAMASNYNLRSASGKEPARPEEASPSYDQGNLEETVNRLVADVATHEEALGFAAETFEGFKEEMKLMREQMAESVAMNRSLSDLVKTLQDEVAGLRASNQRLLRTNSASSSQERTSRVDIQRPVKYSGSRDARAIDNFLFQVDYYLDLQNVVEEDLKIKTAAMLLEGDAVAWWRRKMLDIENGDCTIRTFDDFCKQLKGYFMPVDAERHAYRLVANLKQTGALRDYIRAYQKVMLDVPMMP